MADDVAQRIAEKWFEGMASPRREVSTEQLADLIRAELRAEGLAPTPRMLLLAESMRERAEDRVARLLGSVSLRQRSFHASDVVVWLEQLRAEVRALPLEAPDGE